MVDTVLPRDSGKVSQAALPDSFKGNRNFSTAIMFLLPLGNHSNLHRMAASEVHSATTAFKRMQMVLHEPVNKHSPEMLQLWQPATSLLLRNSTVLLRFCNTTCLSCPHASLISLKAN